MNIHPLIPEDYPVIDSYMQELHDLHVQGRLIYLFLQVTFIQKPTSVK